MNRTFFFSDNSWLVGVEIHDIYGKWCSWKEAGRIIEGSGRRCCSL
jgi:hypothetical protein